MAVTYIRGKQGGWTEEINPDLQSTEERLKRWRATVQLRNEDVNTDLLSDITNSVMHSIKTLHTLTWPWLFQYNRFGSIWTDKTSTSYK